MKSLLSIYMVRWKEIFYLCNVTYFEMIIRLFQHKFIFKINKLNCYITLFTQLTITQLEFKLNLHNIHSQTRAMQYFNTLEKCTQIIREDRIWLRNLIKANNEDVLFLFKGLPKIPNMKQLQIKLRKYINKAKQKQKKEQLLRFKENMQLPEFIEAATQKRAQLCTQNKNQTKFRSPLLQNQGNGKKSSFVTKWNNYTHHNHPNNFVQIKSQVPQISSISQHSRSSKKQWINNYKPHSLNKSSDGQISNKLFNKNKSISNQKQNNQMSHLSKEKSSYKQKDEFQNMNSAQSLGMNSRNSSKSLKQLQNKIYQELRQFQQNKKNKQSQILNKTHSQQPVERYFQKQKPNFNYQQTNYPYAQNSVNFSKQNIDQILKFKLGNCDFQTYKKQRSFQNQQEQDRCLRQKNSSQKKLYNDGLFPPIQQQTERDSQSQRYAQEPLRFGLISSKQQMQDRDKLSFSSYAKVPPGQLKQPFQINKVNESYVSQNKQSYVSQNKTAQSYENQMYLGQIKQSSQKQSNTGSFIKANYQDPLPQRVISESLYQSTQKKSDVHEQSFQSDLHKSIMGSIRKSREDFPNQVFANNFTNSQSIDDSIGKVFHSNTNELTNQLSVPMKSQLLSNLHMSSCMPNKNDDSLFTSPELLNECRNFLKKTQQINFQNSGVGNFTSSIKNTYYESPPNSQQKSFKQTFSNSNVIHFPQPITITESITKQYYQNDSASKINSLFESKQTSLNKSKKVDFQTYSKPCYFRQNSQEKSQFVQSQVNNVDVEKESNERSAIKSDKKVHKHIRGNSSVKRHSQIEETIAFPSVGMYKAQQKLSNKLDPTPSPRISANKYQTSEFDNSPSQQSWENSQVDNSPSQQPWENSQTDNLKIETLVDLEDLIDTILQANQGNIQVQSTWLRHTLDNRCTFTQQVGSTLKSILKEYVEGGHTYNFTQVICRIQDQYKRDPSYQPRKCPSRDVYLLLDIQQKGFVTFEDINNFIQQLQEAQVQNLPEIRANLLEVFQLADFMSLKKISYINLYIIKNEDSFDKLCQDLQQFQFEIQGQQ